MSEVFLGGTCNDTKWRDKIIPLLKVPFFNPVVDDWNEEMKLREKVEKDNCDIHLYVITPQMTGVFSICEVTDDSNKIHNKTVLCILDTNEGKKFEEFQKRSLSSVVDVVKANGCYCCTSLEEASLYINMIGGGI